MRKNEDLQKALDKFTERDRFIINKIADIAPSEDKIKEDIFYLTQSNDPKVLNEQIRQLKLKYKEQITEVNELLDELSEDAKIIFYGTFADDLDNIRNTLSNKYEK